MVFLKFLFVSLFLDPVLTFPPSWAVDNSQKPIPVTTVVLKYNLPDHIFEKGKPKKRFGIEALGKITAWAFIPTS
jgi:hypothetical protein